MSEIPHTKKIGCHHSYKQMWNTEMYNFICSDYMKRVAISSLSSCQPSLHHFSTISVNIKVRGKVQMKTTIYLNCWFYLKKWAGLSLKTEIGEYLFVYRLNTSHLIDQLIFKILCLFCSLKFFCASLPHSLIWIFEAWH